MGYIMRNGVPYGAGIMPITIEGTLVANATSISFTNDAILEGERYNIYAWNKPTVKPTNIVVSGHTLTLTYPAQSTDTRIKVVINENVNALMFDDTNKADKSDLTNIFATGTTNTTGAEIPARTYFYLNGTLCRAKVAIAVNATFTLNTNYEIATIGKELVDLAKWWHYSNASAITVSASTWTKICSISISSSIPRGRYLLVSNVHKDVDAKISYGRLAYNGSVDNVFLGGNMPYGTGCLSTVVDITDTTTSVDLWYYGSAVTVAQYYANLKLIKL